jgi:VanZ family protein
MSKMRMVAPWLAFIVWAIALTALSSIPASRIGPMPFWEADKVVHSLLFGLGAVPVAFIARRYFKGIAPVFGITLAIMMTVALLDEFHQQFTPGRSGMDAGDLTADAVGSMCGILIAWLYGRSSKSHLPAPRADRAA